MEEKVAQTPTAQPQQPQAKAVLKQFPKKDIKKTLPYILISLAIVVAGITTGWLISGRGKPAGVLSPSSVAAPGAKSGATEAGIGDEATFRDSAEGTLVAGGIEGEGTHHLTRNGASQNVYLTSTVIDLESFVGKKVKVWGETISARKAGWLMDVGKIRVTD